VREVQRAAAKRNPQEAQSPGHRRSPEEDRRRREEAEIRRSKAIDMAVETFEALMSERGDGGKVRASVLKDAIKRRKPDFSESYYGFRTFGSLLEEAQARGLLEIGRDDKSNVYVHRAHGGAPARAEVPRVEMPAEPPMPVAVAREPMPVVDEAPVEPVAPAAEAPADVAEARPSRGGRGRGGRKSAAARPAAEPAPVAQPEAVVPAPELPEPVAEAPAAPAKASRPRKTASPRARRPRKAAEPSQG